MNIDISKLNITDVTCEKMKHIKDAIHIRFKIDDSTYLMNLKKQKNGIMQPTLTVHKNGKCNHCLHLNWECLGLRKYQKELFHRLIEFPSIRLEWLYIDHV